MKTAVLVGASSGIGEGLARLLVSNGYTVCITGRRKENLHRICNEFGDRASYSVMDVDDASSAINEFEKITENFHQVDLVVISAGTGFIDPELPWQKEEQTIKTNVSGFAAIANSAYHLFKRQGHGHLVGISSIAAVRGGPAAAYNASKAFVSSYLEGLRCRIVKDGLPIFVTDIRPGLVDTAMAQGEGLFWVQPVDKVARQIYSVIAKKKKYASVTKRWGLIAMLLKILPDAIYCKM